MINKEKIVKLDIYDDKNNHILSTKAFSFPRDFFKVKSQELVVIRERDLPFFPKDKPISVVFQYLNGTRIKYITKVDISTDLQLNFHVGDGEILEERRSSYKVAADFYGISRFFERNDEPVVFDTPLKVHFYNINLGGVLFHTDYEFEKGDLVNLVFMDNKIELMGEILRLQYDTHGAFVGYGTKFTETSHAQEEILTKFIFRYQLEERNRKMMNR